MACLIKSRVAAGDVVLGDSVDLADLGHVLASDALRLHTQHLLKCVQRLHSMNSLAGMCCRPGSQLHSLRACKLLDIDGPIINATVLYQGSICRHFCRPLQCFDPGVALDYKVTPPVSP